MLMRHVKMTPERALSGIQYRRLSPEQLRSLARKLARTRDNEDAERLRDLITRGFYGKPR